MRLRYKTSGTCSRAINFDLEDGVVSNIVFEGGCNGNLKAIAKLLEGSRAEEVIAKLKGNVCGFRGTSCADQLAKALEGALADECRG